MSNYKNISLKLDSENISICISYETVVAFKCDGRDYIIDKYQNYSRSTSKHLNEFFGMDSKEREKAIGSGMIKVIPDSNLKHILK